MYILTKYNVQVIYFIFYHYYLFFQSHGAKLKMANYLLHWVDDREIQTHLMAFIPLRAE